MDSNYFENQKNITEAPGDLSSQSGLAAQERSSVRRQSGEHALHSSLSSDTSVIETPRLSLQKLHRDDLPRLRPILGDAETMYAWEHGFSDDEIVSFLGTNLSRYERDGFSYFLAQRREDGAVVGLIGPLMEEIEGKRYPGVAYILARQYWGHGYATEGASACIEYLYRQGFDAVIAEIRPENTASVRVAERLGMKPVGSFIKQYHGKEMPHTIYLLQKLSANESF